METLTKKKQKVRNTLDKRKRIWSQKELEILETYCGVIPFSQVVKKIIYLNRREGLRPRKPSAIFTKAKKLKLSVDSEGNFYSFNDLMKIFGVGQNRLYIWLKDSEMRTVLNPIRKNKESGWYYFNFRNIALFTAKYRSEIIKYGNPNYDFLLSLIDEVMEEFADTFI